MYINISNYVLSINHEFMNTYVINRFTYYIEFVLKNYCSNCWYCDWCTFWNWPYTCFCHRGMYLCLSQTAKIRRQNWRKLHLRKQRVYTVISTRKFHKIISLIKHWGGVPTKFQ